MENANPDGVELVGNGLLAIAIGIHPIRRML